jgi:predicted transcriptional regulator
MDREQSVAEQVSAPAIDLYRVARIVGSYMGHHQIEPGQRIRLIAEVHRALGGLGQAAPPAPRQPAVPIRQSVHPEYVVCLECGFRGKILCGHLAGTTRAQSRGLSDALEFAAASSADGTELFGAARGNG